MSIFNLQFTQLGGVKARAAQESKPRKNISVKRTVNHGKEVTQISISAALMKDAGLKTGDRVLFGIAETDKGMVVKIWADQINGYRLSPRNTNLKSAEAFGKYLDSHCKSLVFNAIPAGEYSGKNVGASGNDLYFLVSKDEVTP